MSEEAGVNIDPVQVKEEEKKGKKGKKGKKEKKVGRTAKGKEGKPLVRGDEIEIVADDGTMSNVLDLPTEVHRFKGGDGNEFSVTVVGDRSKQAIVTFHDVGLNHASCFNRFLSFMSSEGPKQSLYRHFCFYHIDAPGHEPNRPSDVEVKPYTLDDLAASVHVTCTRLQLQSVYGFGVGAGASVLLKFAAAQPRLIKGLLLCSPVADKCGWTEWASWKMLENMIRLTGMSSFAKNQLFNMYFSDWALQENTDLHIQHSNELAEQDPQLLLHYIRAFYNRTDFHQDIEAIHCNTLVFAGVRSYAHSSTIEVIGHLKNDIVNYITIHKAAHMVLEENPQRLAQPVRLYFQGDGWKFT